MTRPSWDETWLSVARTIARRSLCSRDQVGAVVVSATNRLLETGYNGPPAGFQTDLQPCTEWCPRTNPEPTGWRAIDGGPDISLEYENGKIYAVMSGGQVRHIASDETLRRMGFQPIFELEKDYSDCPALHAEANALMRGDRVAREGGTIYTTSHVCMGCAKLIANSGLEYVVIGAQHDGAHREPEKVYRFLDQCGISVMIA
jgi:dCMP deaminase